MTKEEKIALMKDRLKKIQSRPGAAKWTGVQNKLKRKINKM
jgi:hypothetical protein